MQKQIWYGVKNNQVEFAEEPNALTQHGINNPRSFTVNGDITGLSLVGSNAQAGTSQQQTA